MPTIQERILQSFEVYLNDIKNDEIEEKNITKILSRVIDLAVKEDRGEIIDANINAETNNFTNLF